MGCGCGKSFSQTYATGSRSTSHVPSQRPVVQQIQSKSLQARASAQVQQAVRRKV